MQIDNSHFGAKVKLREKAIQGLKQIKVLDCYGGQGLLWDSLKVRHNIEVTGIDKVRGKNKWNLVIDNRKVLMGIDLNKFDLIDLDAYGIPFAQLQIVLERVTTELIIVVTFISSNMGRLPSALMRCNNFTDQMILKAPTLCSRNPKQQIINYLCHFGIDKINIVSFDNKHYFYFKTKTKQ